jgi:serine phosphatase RsbU (regulator of sigma subunit)/CheY-like chemotaxis protein
MRVLLVEDNPDHAVWIGELLAAVRAAPIDLTCADRLAGAFARLAEGGIDVVLLDLALPDSHGLDTVARMRARAPRVPIVVLTVLEDEGVGVKAVQMGAQDYLPKSRLDVDLLHRVLRYAIERQQADEALQAEHRLLQSVVESVGEGLVVADTAGNIVLLNAAASRILGAGPTDAPPEQWAEHYGLYLPDQVTLCPAAALPLAPAMRGEVVSEVELFLRHPRRAEDAWLSGTATPLRDRDGAVQGGVVVFQDITDHKQAERQKAQILAARAVQQKLFPSRAPRVAGYDLAGAAYPAEAASGDYFDFVPLADGCLGVAVGDVSGHGLGPALLMAQTRTCLRTLAQGHADIGAILTLANRMLAEDTTGDPFVTLFFGRLDPRAHTFDYAGAGHHAYLFPCGGEARRLDATGPPLGVVPDGDVGCAPPIHLNPGDLVLLATDGIWEAPSPDGSPFGNARVAQTIACYREDSARELVSDLYHTVRAFSQNLPQQDDITAVVLTRLQP